MGHYFQGRSLTHLGCALGVTLGLTLGLVVGALLAYSFSLAVVGWAVAGLTVGLGLAGWVAGALLTQKNKAAPVASPSMPGNQENQEAHADESLRR
jgi:hypothetical protein